jgi:nicotinamide-nucleotide amidase
MFSPNSDFEVALAFDVLNACKRAGVKLATAESCTGGLVAAALTAIPGSSDVVERGFVTYSNEAKEEMLAVSPALLRAFGAVSEPVAKAMAEGALNRSHADIAVSITGVAGPGGGSPEKPVGLVHFGLARKNRPTLATHRIFPGDRAAVRRQAVDQALTMVLEGLA